MNPEEFLAIINSSVDDKANEFRIAQKKYLETKAALENAVKQRKEFIKFLEENQS